MSKTISTGTLSLRFMQNAQRAKQLKETELDRAEVQDDGKWEVSQAVREAWGLAPSKAGASSSSQSLDVHEASYLPFLYPGSNQGDGDSDDTEYPPRKTFGRRVFNKRGEEVSLDQTSSTDLPAVDVPDSTTSSSTGRKAHPRPISISAGMNKSSLLKGFDDEFSGTSKKLKSKRPEGDTKGKSARQAIFETGNVGLDLRARPEPIPHSSTFLKPAGVDDPKDLLTSAASTSALTSSKPKSKAQEIVEGARQKKAKRERDPASEETGESVKKPKKKKKKNPE